MIETTGEGKSAVATPDGKKPKEEEEEDLFAVFALSNLVNNHISIISGDSSSLVMDLM